MQLTTKQIKNSLGRVKLYYQKNEIKRALEAAVYALQNVGATANTEVRSSIREVIQLISRDEQVKKFSTAPMIYQPGSESIILKQLIKIYNKIKEEDSKVSHKQRLERKINLDRLFNEGIKALKNKNSTAADENFAQALTFYEDEHHIYYMIALALKEAGEIRRAYPYAKRGAELSANSKSCVELFQEIESARNAL